MSRPHTLIGVLIGVSPLSLTAAPLRPFLAEASVVLTEIAEVATIATVNAVMMDLRNMLRFPECKC